MESIEKKPGSEQTSTLKSMTNLASTYKNQGRLDATEKLGVGMLEANKPKLGADHPSTLVTIDNLNSFSEGRSNIPDTKEMHLRAPRGKERAASWASSQIITRPLYGEDVDTIHNDSDDEEEYDNADMESILSTPSGISSQSSVPPREEIFLAASELSVLLLGVEELNKLLAKAYLRLGQQRFASNIAKLLTDWGRRLRSEVSGKLQHQVAQFVQKFAHQIARQLGTQLAIASGLRPFELGHLHPNRSRRVNDWIESFDGIKPQSADALNIGSEENSYDDVEEDSDEELEERSDIGHDDANISLEAAKAFLLNSKGLEDLCSDLRRWMDGSLPKGINSSLNTLLDHGVTVKTENAQHHTAPLFAVNTELERSSVKIEVCEYFLSIIDRVQRLTMNSNLSIGQVTTFFATPVSLAKCSS